ncbi:MAG: iron complex transport system ATP-binding protein [Planctomycetota bacterium]|jgi:iron complex transport system ATP-binding protein
MRLEYRDLVFEYPGMPGEAPTRAVNGLSGGLSTGEMQAVIGPNGAGKSTLVKLLAALEEAGEGSVLFDGSPLSELAHKERARKIAVVPQSLAAVPVVHVGDFVLGGRYAHLERWRGPQRSDREAVSRALTACDCEGLEGRLMTRISGGQRQRVLIARALAQESPFLLVDEPTNSLDPAHQLAIFELLGNLVREGRAVLVVTHDLNLASQFVHSMLLLDGGRIVCEGTPEKVLAREVLEPVYGRGLTYGSLPIPGGESRPFVLPWGESGSKP